MSVSRASLLLLARFIVLLQSIFSKRPWLVLKRVEYRSAAEPSLSTSTDTLNSRPVPFQSDLKLHQSVGTHLSSSTKMHVFLVVHVDHDTEYKVWRAYMGEYDVTVVEKKN